MAKDKKSGGFFAAFRTPPPSGNETLGTKAPVPASNTAKSSTVHADVKISSVAAAPSSAAVPVKSVPVPTAKPEPPIDTVEAFKTLCQAVGDIAASQLKVAEMLMRMLAGSLNKISEGVKPEK